jgi:hypothetical protein
MSMPEREAKLSSEEARWLETGDWLLRKEKPAFQGGLW